AGPTSRSRTSAGACASPPSCGRGDRNWKGRGRSFTLEAMKRLARWFFQGLIYFVPIALTAFVLWVSFRTIDRGLGGLLGFEVPGAGFLLLVVLVAVLGFLLSNFLARRLLRSLEGVLDRLPLIKLLHGSVKDLMGAFVGEERRF